MIHANDSVWPQYKAIRLLSAMSVDWTKMNPHPTKPIMPAYSYLHPVRLFMLILPTHASAKTKTSSTHAQLLHETEIDYTVVTLVADTLKCMRVTRP